MERRGDTAKASIQPRCRNLDGSKRSNSHFGYIYLQLTLQNRVLLPNGPKIFLLVLKNSEVCLLYSQ
jgi:hypothetical protein